MAEEKVCDDVVSKSKEEVSERVEGESLLLPLLQGLLDAPENEQTADSGTESGEDLRNGLLIEVQNVLTKLATSLKSDSNEMTPDRRNSLLQLVTRLQTGLGSQSSNSGERRSSGAGRFTRRKRQNRHTVGVSSVELEDARKLIEEFRLNDLKSSKIPLQKQHSEGSVLQPTSQIRPFTKNNKPGVKNAVAKPYNSSANTSQSHSGASSTVDTPTEPSEIPDFPSLSLDDCIDNRSKRVTKKSRPLSEIILSNQVPSPEIITMSKFNVVPPPPPVPLEDSNPESEVEDACKTLTSSNLVSQTFQNHPVHDYRASVVLKTNPIYSKPEEYDESKIYNKFNYKKQKMKRANTIDIPKQVVYHESEDDYDSDTSLDKQSSRRNNYYALRGPIRVGRHSVANSNVPTFEPKTESDKKFMAFINQHNDNFNKNSLWAHQKEQLHSKKDNNWNNRFGNIRTAFEKASTSNPSTPTSNISSARNFWKTAENTTLTTEKSTGAFRNQQPRFEKEVPKLTSPDQANVVTGSLKVDTKGLEKGYKLVPQPSPLNKFSHAPTSAFAAIPKKTNYLAPMPQTRSVFKPIAQPVLEPVIKKEPVLVTSRDLLPKVEYNESDSNSSTPLYLYSPKPLLNPQPSANTSPSQTPWANNINKNRVQKLVTSKFENATPEVPEVSVSKPRRISKSNFQTPIKEVPQLENITAPYLVKSADRSSSVKKLSNQFNYNSNNPDTYSSHTTVKYDQFLNNYAPQNYSITYTKQPQNYPLGETRGNVHEKKLDVESKLRQKFDQKIKDLSTVQNYGDYKRSSRDVLPEYAPSDASPIVTRTSPKYQRQVSQESLKEYEAAQTRVMKGPVSHQAVTTQQNAPKSRSQHDMEAAFNLKNVLQKFAQPEDSSQGSKIKSLADRKLSIDSAIRKQSKSPLVGLRSQSFRKSPYESDAPNFLVNGNPLSLESTEIIENGESVITSKFHIPVTLGKPQGRDYRSPPQQALSKTESCHQLARTQPKSPESFKPVVKSRSTHTLAIPTLQYQAAMTKDEVVQKRRTVEAYFCGGPSPQSLSRTPSDDSLDKIERDIKQNKSTINRKKTCEKVSAHKHSGVARSRTLPNIVCPNLLDESRVEESFEDLFKSNA